LDFQHGNGLRVFSRHDFPGCVGTYSVEIVLIGILMIGLSWDEGLLPKRNSVPSPSWVVNQMDKTEHGERKDKKK
jgi:hypothetical protein